MRYRNVLVSTLSTFATPLALFLLVSLWLRNHPLVHAFTATNRKHNQAAATTSTTSSSTSSSTPHILLHVRPSQVHLAQVTHRYKPTLWRTLTSSVPRRPYALQNVTLALQSGFYLLTGPSSSGKSTMFSLLTTTTRDQEQRSDVTGGSVTIGVANATCHCFQTTTTTTTTNNNNNNENTAVASWCVVQKETKITRNQANDTINDNPPLSAGDKNMAARPILLDEKPHAWNNLRNRNVTPRQWLHQRLVTTPLSRRDNNNNNNNNSNNVVSTVQEDALLVNVLIHALVHDDDQDGWMDGQQHGQELSQSQLYVVQLVQAAWQSMASCRQRCCCCCCNDQDDCTITLPAPILLLDEWLDKETSTVIQAVQGSLQSLVMRTGAVVVCATHVPQRFACWDRHHHHHHHQVGRVRLQSGRLV